MIVFLILEGAEAAIINIMLKFLKLPLIFLRLNFNWRYFI
jgi:hypothetical protein